MILDTIYNVNSYEFVKTLPDKCVDLVYTDIPYEMASFSLSGIYRTRTISSEMREHKQNLLDGIDYSILDDLCRICKRIYMYIWCNKTQIPKILNYFMCKKVNFNILCWCKTNPTPLGKSPFLSDIEYLLCFYESGCLFNKGIDLKSKFYVSATNQKDRKLYDHPTIKPLEFVKRSILLSTKKGDIVFDPFMGSGTTAIACKELGRHFIGCEIDKHYYNIALDRLKGITQRDRKQGVEQLKLFDYEIL